MFCWIILYNYITVHSAKNIKFAVDVTFNVCEYQQYYFLCFVFNDGHLRAPEHIVKNCVYLKISLLSPNSSVSLMMIQNTRTVY